ncbi:MAG TPA: glycerophosphodiester phosphodiesterase family protein [Pyrinomonadaceae bacterium]|nr:glycerophosphodiester phosphodiesterase family protein [Pyrinomonadaceae bacterium]
MSPPLIIAHRGASAVAPENTIAAFQAAIDAGADGIEFDVRLTREGVPVVIHDETLYRTTGVRGRVADASLDQLNDLGVPTVAQVLELISSSGLILYLELKETQIELVEKCCRSVKQYDLQDRLIFACFEHSVLQTIKNLNPWFQTAALFHSSDAFILERARAIRADGIALHHRLATAGVVEDATQAGLKVAVWTVDDPAWVKHARAMGIYAIITNNPAALIQLKR